MLTWQTNKEWWGHNAVAHSNDFRFTINEMDGRCFWSIREDQSVLAKGISTEPLDAVMKIVGRRFATIKFSRLFRGKKNAVA